MPGKSKPQSVPSEPALHGRLTDRKRASIVQAAVEAFQQYGYFAASMNGIAEAASVSKRTLYNHFDSKEALFIEIIEELKFRVEQLPECKFDDSRDLAEQLTELAQSEIDFFTSEDVQALARAGLSRVLGEPDAGQQVDQRFFIRRVTTWMKKAQASGCLLEADAEFAAMQFVGLLRTFAFWPTIVHGEPPPSRRKRNQIVAQTVEMFLSRYAVN
ncbi:HTH-type transcriptional regulator RutR [Rubripirellula amarantea]|uniref:HTH-type transcriptional regulator RutR n=1 Tax=Rubripirellula amarantea TaxID=2527999 RepID=A0A5C5WLE5_9BACT|nr:TetR/AcrR family transcriptional regulator [Rubripirellula amarantea]TWT50949.1 HTH-type transcriptional regulator RutR [Rubripirellula amarantea]